MIGAAIVLVGFGGSTTRSFGPWSRRLLASGSMNFLEFGFKHGKGEKKSSAEEGKDGHVDSCDSSEERTKSQRQEQANDDSDKGEEHNAATGLHDL
jgi:hypothetical protein